MNYRICRRVHEQEGEGGQVRSRSFQEPEGVALVAVAQAVDVVARGGPGHAEPITETTATLWSVTRGFCHSTAPITLTFGTLGSPLNVAGSLWLTAAPGAPTALVSCFSASLLADYELESYFALRADVDVTDAPNTRLA